MKKSISIILSILIMITSLPITSLSVSAQESEKTETVILTRAEWISKLVETFSMQVNETAVPDNYFADLDKSHIYYDDIITAVGFGTIKIPAGEKLRPDDPVTRDFSTSTLNFCLSFQKEEDKEYTFTDYELCSDPDSAQIALDRGWLSPIDNLFCPELEITENEAEIMLKDAANILKKQEIDPNYKSTYQYAKDVIVIEEETEVFVDEKGFIYITDCPQVINKGDKIAVSINNIPNVYTALSVSVIDNITIIETQKADSKDAFKEIDIQGVAEFDINNITPIDNSKISMLDTDSDNPEQEGSSIVIENELTIDNSTINFSVTMDDINIPYKISGTHASVALASKVTVTYEFTQAKTVDNPFDSKTSLDDKIPLDIEIPLFIYSVAGIGNIEVVLTYACEGSISGSIEGDLLSGISYSLSDGFRMIRNFKQSKSYISAEISAEVALQVRLGVTTLPVIEAYVYGEVGINATLSVSSYLDNEKPEKCCDFNAHLFVNFGATAGIDLDGEDLDILQYDISIEEPLFDEDNSPMRLAYHYEDMTLVPSCTRENDGPNYFTSADSCWSGCGWSEADSSFGLHTDGTICGFYEYVLNENNEATITKYLGNSLFVNIPAKIGGYTVVGIGNSAFSKKDIICVDIPDTVTYIGVSAFNDCIMLKSVTLPKSLKVIDKNAFAGCITLEKISLPNGLTTLNGRAFGSCTSLKEVLIPNTIVEVVPEGESFYSQYYGPFYGCANLKTAVIEDGMKAIPAYLFATNENLETVIIPDSVTAINTFAFYRCYSLKNVEFPDTLTSIGKYAFRHCTSLESIDLPNTLTTIAEYAFGSCSSLKNIDLPDNLTTLNGCAFASCTSLTEVLIPKSVVNVANGGDAYYSQYYGPFYGCTNLKTAVIEEGMKAIPAYLFATNENLETVIIPDSVTVINTLAFYRCYALKNIDFSDTLTSIGTYAFRHCRALESVELPESLISLGDYAFANCTALNDITIYEGVKTIGKNALTTPGFTTIYGKTGSLAETFATKNGYNFKVISDIKLGDTNGDGEITITDVTVIQKYLAEIVQLDTDSLTASDVTSDGEINIKDVTMIQMYLAQVINEF